MLICFSGAASPLPIAPPKLAGWTVCFQEFSNVGRMARMGREAVTRDGQTAPLTTSAVGTAVEPSPR